MTAEKMGLLTGGATPFIRATSGHGGRPDADISNEVVTIRAEMFRSSGYPPHRSYSLGGVGGNDVLWTRKMLTK